MRVLVLSTVFPNAMQSTFGLFVKERSRRLAEACDLMVVAPVPWFPLNDRIRRRPLSAIPAAETVDGLRVQHPRFLCVPRFGKALDGVLYAVSLLPVLTRLRREFPFDVIDAQFAYPDGLAAVLLGRALGVPVTITLRGSIIRLATYRLHRPQLRWALRRAARVFSVSESLEQVAVGLGIAPAAIRVVPNGVDADRFAPRERAAARRALGLPAQRPLLLSVGGVNEGKGHHRVIGVLPELLEHHPDLLYVVVGGERPGDSSRPLIDALVARHRLDDHLLLAGERPHEEIPVWLAAADVFVLATRSEGSCNALLESLACGRPVVSTRVGGNPEIVSREDLGILVEPGDDMALAAGIARALTQRWNPEVIAARPRPWDTTVAAVHEELAHIVDPPPQAERPVEPPATWTLPARWWRSRSIR